MIINNEGKLFGKVSIIDILVIIAILTIGVGFYFKFISPDSKVTSASQTIEYVMKIRDVRMYTVNALEKKGKMVDPRTHEELGTIESVKYDPCVQEDVLLDGSFKELAMPDKYDAYITVRVNGKVSDSGYYTYQNRALAGGSGINLCTKYVSTSGDIISIKAVD